MDLLAGKTIFITGASRGIGREIALKCASAGANVVIAAKSAEPHPKLPGTIFSVAEEIKAAGGNALPIELDVRKEIEVKKALALANETFGSLDCIVNNAGAISLTNVEQTSPKRYDLMHHVNTRGTFLVTKYCLPYLKKSKFAHVICLSPPLSFSKKWYEGHVAYSMAKMGMSMLINGWSAEFEN